MAELEEDQAGLLVYPYYQTMNPGEDQPWSLGLLQVHLMWVQPKNLDAGLAQFSQPDV